MFGLAPPVKPEGDGKRKQSEGTVRENSRRVTAGERI